MVSRDLGWLLLAVFVVVVVVSVVQPALLLLRVSLFPLEPVVIVVSADDMTARASLLLSFLKVCCLLQGNSVVWVQFQEAATDTRDFDWF